MSPSSLPPSVFSLLRVKLLFIAQYPNIFYSEPISAPSILMCFASSLASPLSSTRVQQRVLPPLLVTLLPLPCLAAGHGERKNEETKHFRLYTARGKTMVWFPPCCVRRLFCLFGLCVCFSTSSTLHSESDRHIDELGNSNLSINVSIYLFYPI